MSNHHDKKECGGWTLIGKNDISGQYTHAPGFYDDGRMPTKSNLGSISLFKFRDNSVIKNNTQFIWLDTSTNQYIKFYLSKIENIIADNYTKVNDDIGIRFISQNITSSSILNSYCAVKPIENPNNLSGGFFSTISASGPDYGNYGYAYFAGTMISNKRSFSISNNSGYECGYSIYGLGRYSPTPYVYSNVVFMFK